MDLRREESLSLKRYCTYTYWEKYQQLPSRYNKVLIYTCIFFSLAYFWRVFIFINLKRSTFHNSHEQKMYLFNLRPLYIAKYPTTYPVQFHFSLFANYIKNNFSPTPNKLLLYQFFQLNIWSHLAIEVVNIISKKQ